MRHPNEQLNDEKISEISDMLLDTNTVRTMEGWRQRCEFVLSQLQQTREELEQERKTNDKYIEMYEVLCEESEQVKAELSAKDKVLEWYADAKNYTYQFYYGDDPNDPDELEEPIMSDDGEQARTILQSYPPREKGADNHEDK